MIFAKQVQMHSKAKKKAKKSSDSLHVLMSFDSPINSMKVRLFKIKNPVTIQFFCDKRRVKVHFLGPNTWPHEIQDLRYSLKELK